MSTCTPYLRLEQLGKRYGETAAVEGVDLSIAQGEFISLLGPSGCGKTTTLQMIAGFVAPSTGRILLEGRDLTPVPPEKRGLGIVFQSYALFPHMTVAQNVAFGLDMRRVDPGDKRRRVQDALELVHLGAHAGRYPRELSGGQRQRVALARALVIAPPVLLLDEPLSNLDAKLREQMQDELRAIQRQVGTTTIMVTHDQAEALAISDRVVLLNAGRVVRIDTPHDVYEDPRATFAAHFIGQTNLITGQLDVRGDVAVLDAQGHRLAVTAAHATAAGGPATFSLRPERIRLTSATAGRVAGRVGQRSFHGNHWVITVATALGELRVLVSNDGVAAANDGDAVGLDWADDALRLVREGA
ncbi:spermidine/putrescine ABC transporter ATPase [Pandoraea pnomenusa]|uniref:Spermidine/putrescine ABC transporter ATPase n=1 Tax=Pandoraea pnomenusa TaxID=93220 RepID=A0ABY6WKI9_9BURK|nr:ABC transporter ATP-binding protein [Pandoraea pnomenusa]ANC43224.1 Fe3+/spermidine/putrescine ABC transporter ATP-binding protein [Pandoraea pnomenusa]QDH60420.1 ABC transporter ATP-binding protein [Pandoraea pnomenusa]VVE67558.1 spermidine/putrescine ABC transporter ATPase [Pandoraea pnomenusa]